jgi:hypothetical protein
MTAGGSTSGSRVFRPEGPQSARERTDDAAPKLDPVALMFSGGLDSAAAAILLAQTHREVHLLTFGNGHGHLMVGRAKGAGRDLARRFPGRVFHHLTSVAPLFRELVTADLPGTYARYRSRFVWCFGCKLAMHSATIAYCLAHGVGTASDGSSRETSYYVEQSPLGLQLIHSLYTEHGLDFSTPVHRISNREEARRLLEDHGIRQGFRFRDRNPGTQPICVPGNGIYFLSTFFSLHPEFPPDQVTRFFEDKAPACRVWIARALAEGGPA